MADEPDIIEGSLSDIDGMVEELSVTLAPSIPPPIELPQAGRDLTPTPEMIEAGQHGNGSWNLTDTSVAMAWQERHQAKKDAEDERLAHFNNEAKDALTNAVRLHNRVINAAQIIMDKIEAGDERVNGAELNILGKGLASAKELTDRAAGKARTSQETTSEVTGLAFILQGGD